jgi:hypothetical protein
VIRWAQQQQEITMTSTALTNVQQALAYACSELGETMTLSSGGTLVSTKKDYDRKTVVLNGVSIATAETHVLSVHPKIGSIVG